MKTHLKFHGILLGSLALVCGLVGNAQTTTKLTADKANEYGLIYYLPKTALEVTLEVRKTVKTPGEFYAYAKKLLGVTPITKASTSYEVLGGVINPVGVVDEEEQYLVNYKGGSAVTMVVTENSFPLSINDDGYVAPNQQQELPQAQGAQATILETPAAMQAMTEEMLLSKSTAKRAELAAKRIIELRQERRDIAAGNADNMPSDGKALELALKTLDEQEAALTAMFAGTTKTSTEVQTYDVDLAEDGSLEKEILCRLSQTRGLIPAEDLGGDPVYLEVREISRGELPVNEKGIQKTFPKGGVAYRIPGEAVATVEYDGRQVTSRKISVAQLGVVFGLDPTLFNDKKVNRYQHFNPLDGSLKEQGIKE